MTIEEIVDKQMKAYDERDIEAMMSVFSKDIQIINFSTKQVIVDGADDCRKMYIELFNQSPNLRAEILNTIAIDNKIIVQEYIHGRNGSTEKMEQVVIFDVNNEKINRLHVIRK